MAEPFRRLGVATLLMDEAEQLAAIEASRAGHYVGLFDEYGRRSGYTGGAAISPTAGAHARVRGRA